MLFLGMTSLKKENTVIDITEGLQWLEKAFDKGEITVATMLGRAYSTGEGVDQSYEKAVIWFRKGAEQDEPKSQYFLGQFYQLGFGVEQNTNTAIVWLEKSANQNDEQAIEGLARIHMELPTPNLQVASYWFKRAADLGVTNAMSDLGYIALETNGEVVDYDTAFRYLHEGADKGDAHCMFNLAEFYHIGAGVEKDVDKQLELLKKASSTGNHFADIRLGFLFEENNDFVEAVTWFQKAANGGISDACHKLISIYTEGREGVPADPAQVGKYQKLIEEETTNSN
eukprot:TRINITY_DN1807_c0_g1_i2.p2 TRINITY_DN1807_c0_g1~~TRINITY_DN1807_c0_g1_i2.p2  ORF type:complete len:284 (+),score=78.16 TRINITY_DN1807_c0_g1_i2:477-1328(+)